MLSVLKSVLCVLLAEYSWPLQVWHSLTQMEKCSNKLLQLLIYLSFFNTMHWCSPQKLDMVWFNDRLGNYYQFVGILIVLQCAFSPPLPSLSKKSPPFLLLYFHFKETQVCISLGACIGIMDARGLEMKSLRSQMKRTTECPEHTAVLNETWMKTSFSPHNDRARKYSMFCESR